MSDKWIVVVADDPEKQKSYDEPEMIGPFDTEAEAAAYAAANTPDDGTAEVVKLDPPPGPVHRVLNRLVAAYNAAREDVPWDRAYREGDAIVHTDDEGRVFAFRFDPAASNLDTKPTGQ